MICSLNRKFKIYFLFLVPSPPACELEGFKEMNLGCVKTYQKQVC